eukprot:2675264-Prorocentrum_lima.AAC.1
MLNREGEAHLQLQQSIQGMATELIRVTYVTATSRTRWREPQEMCGTCSDNLDSLCGSTAQRASTEDNARASARHQ